MWIEPERAELSFGLYGGGELEFGRAARGGGQIVGTCPMMARVRVPRASGGAGIPTGWFRVNQSLSPHALRALFNEAGNNFLPDWLRADLFEHHYREAQSRLELLEGSLQVESGRK